MTAIDRLLNMPDGEWIELTEKQVATCRRLIRDWKPVISHLGYNYIFDENSILLLKDINIV
jgi:hypothetical protein